MLLAIVLGLGIGLMFDVFVPRVLAGLVSAWRRLRVAARPLSVAALSD